jgi:hypothetical protein
MGTLELKGASGKMYLFTMYSTDTNWKDNVACVYYISKRTMKSGGVGQHSGIYVGESEDLKARHSSHHKQDCFEQHGFNCISILMESSSQARLRIEQDLVRALTLPCND